MRHEVAQLTGCTEGVAISERAHPTHTETAGQRSAGSELGWMN